MTCRCNHCSRVLEFEESELGQTFPCPHCGLDTVLYRVPIRDKIIEAVAGPPPTKSPPVMEPQYVDTVGTARLRFDRKTSLGGLALELVGIVMLFLFPIGTIIGAVMIYAGHQASKVWRCSNCGNLVESRQVRICAACHSNLR